jgi:flagellin-like protein
LIPKMVKSRKAISPILATLLLVVIAVAAIVVTYAWIMTYMGNAGRQAGVMLFKANVNFYNEGGKKIDIDIGNSGTTDTNITVAYIGTSASTLQKQTITSVLVRAGASDPATITVTYDWAAGSTYYFKVISSSGQSLDWPEQAPNT